MSEQTKIQWTDATVNFWTGCKKVSAGCKYCYMYRDKERYGKDPSEVVLVSDKTIFSILKKLTAPSRIFTCSWSDFFIEEADQWRDKAWQIIKDYPQHQWQILTKRPERINECLPADWGNGYENVWLGVTVENQVSANERIWQLIDTPAKVKFVSAEPLLEEVDLWMDKCLTGNFLEDKIDWVIVGGESGNDTGKYLYRPCKLEWIESIVNQCIQNKVPVFVKQMGTHLTKELKMSDRHGGNIDEFPQHLRIRQFPVL